VLDWQSYILVVAVLLVQAVLNLLNAVTAHQKAKAEAEVLRARAESKRANRAGGARRKGGRRRA
jgi:hypothetical protein